MAILFFDNFDDNVLDPTKWFGGAPLPWASLAEQNGHLESDNPSATEAVLAITSGALYQPNLIGREFIWKMSSYNFAITPSTSSFVMKAYPAFNKDLGLAILEGVWIWYLEGGYGTSFDVTPPILVDNQMYACKIKIISLTQIEWYIDDVLVLTSNPATPLTIDPPILLFMSDAYGKFNDFVVQDIPVADPVKKFMLFC